jgi:hypothetical protein
VIQLSQAQTRKLLRVDPLFDPEGEGWEAYWAGTYCPVEEPIRIWEGETSKSGKEE